MTLGLPSWPAPLQALALVTNPRRALQQVVTHATSYYVLVEGVVLYPLGVTIDFWEETT